MRTCGAGDAQATTKKHDIRTHDATLHTRPWLTTVKSLMRRLIELSTQHILACENARSGTQQPDHGRISDAQSAVRIDFVVSAGRDRRIVLLVGIDGPFRDQCWSGSTASRGDGSFGGGPDFFFAAGAALDPDPEPFAG
jgi:hypothetical protein